MILTPCSGHFASRCEYAANWAALGAVLGAALVFGINIGSRRDPAASLDSEVQIEVVVASSFLTGTVAMVLRLARQHLCGVEPDEIDEPV